MVQNKERVRGKKVERKTTTTKIKRLKEEKWRERDITL